MPLKSIRIMEGCGNKVSCRNLFKNLKVLPLTSQYLLSLLMFIVQNKNLFLTNIESHNIDARQGNNVYLPLANDFPIHPHHPPPPRQTTVTPDKRITTMTQNESNLSSNLLRLITSYALERSRKMPTVCRWTSD